MPKLNLTRTQKKMLRDGYRRALKLPDGFGMGNWILRDDDMPCGTAGCYAYELAVVHGRFKPLTLLQKTNDVRQDFHVASYASKLVGIAENDMAIFYTGNWPVQLRNRYMRATTPQKRAQALRDAVEDFIAEDGDW